MIVTQSSFTPKLRLERGKAEFEDWRTKKATGKKMGKLWKESFVITYSNPDECFFGGFNAKDNSYYK